MITPTLASSAYSAARNAIAPSANPNHGVKADSSHYFSALAQYFIRVM